MPLFRWHTTYSITLPLPYPTTLCASTLPYHTMYLHSTLPLPYSSAMLKPFPPLLPLPFPDFVSFPPRRAAPLGASSLSLSPSLSLNKFCPRDRNQSPPFPLIRAPSQPPSLSSSPSHRQFILVLAYFGPGFACADESLRPTGWENGWDAGWSNPQ